MHIFFFSLNMDHQKFLYFGHLIDFVLQVHVRSLKVWYNNIIGKSMLSKGKGKNQYVLLDSKSPF